MSGPRRLAILAGPLALVAAWVALGRTPDARAQAPIRDPRAGGSRMPDVPEPTAPPLPGVPVITPSVHFTDVTKRARVGHTGWDLAGAWGDYDGDGWPDLYLANEFAGNALYHNNHDGSFTEVTKEAGVADYGWGLAGAWGDYNGDGRPDILVGNEFGTKSLYRNNGDGTFTDVARAAGTLDRGAAMGVAWGDVDNDGDLDLYVSNMYANSRWALLHPEFPPPVPWYLGWAPRERVDRIIDELTRGSTLLRNNGDGTFTDVSDAAGVRDAQWGWGAEFVDYDNDGWQDIFASNGFITGPNPDDL